MVKRKANSELESYSEFIARRNHLRNLAIQNIADRKIDMRRQYAAAKKYKKRYKKYKRSNRSLAKAVVKLQKAVYRNDTPMIYYSYDSGYHNISNNVSQTFCLTIPSSFVPVFNTPASVTGSKMYLHSLRMNITLTAGNEYANTTIQLYLFQIKDEIATAFNAANGALGLTANNHVQLIDGMAHFNPVFIKVLKKKTIIIGSNNITPSGTVNVEPTNLIKTFRWNLKPKILNDSGYGSAISQGCFHDPSKNIYFYCCSNNCFGI